MTWLSERKIESLTRKRRPSAQARVLKEAGIPFRLVDGRPVVLERDIVPSQVGRDTSGPRLRLA